MIIAHTGTVESFVGWVQPTGNTARPVGCTHLERLGAYDTGPPPVAYVARLGGTGFASAPLTAKNGGRTSRSWICAILLAVSQLAGIACGADGPRSPAESMKAFVLADPDLTIELVASEPEVTSPVAIAWDEDGRLYVAEMTDYPAARHPDESGVSKIATATVDMNTPRCLQMACPFPTACCRVTAACSSRPRPTSGSCKIPMATARLTGGKWF